VNSLSVVRRPSIAVLACCALFVAANLLAPLLLGDVYPFTIAPMFRDAPRQYCNLRMYAPDGTLLADNSTRRSDPVGSPDPFRLRRYYDGNPVGVGVGICPPETLDRFGEAPDEQAVRRHVAACLREQGNLAYVEVEQEFVGAIDRRRVGVQRTLRFRVDREEATP
jgi:hypothetical protein